MENTGRSRIFIALGANLEHPTLWASPARPGGRAGGIGPAGRRRSRVSPWYRTAPIPASDQPWYVNAVAEVATDLGADAPSWRVSTRSRMPSGASGPCPMPPALIDLDLLDFNGETAAEGPARATLPHPRMESPSPFVLRPPWPSLAPDWRHPRDRSHHIGPAGRSMTWSAGRAASRADMVTPVRGCRQSGARATLPHPRMESRAFVLRPLADLAPDWRHPRTGVTISALLAASCRPTSVIRAALEHLCFRGGRV